MARSICAGLRGGSTAMVGTSTGTAPYARSRSLISPAWSLVRGTSTRQPNSGRLSHQDSRARLSTAVPTVATTGPLKRVQPGGLLGHRDELGDDALLRRPRAAGGDDDRGAAGQAALDQPGGGVGQLVGLALQHQRAAGGRGGTGEGGQVHPAAQVGGHRGAAEGHAGEGRDGGGGGDARHDVEGHGGAADGEHLLDHGVGGVRVAGDQPDDDAAVLGGGHGGLGHLGRLAGRGAQLGLRVRLADGVLDRDGDVGVHEDDGRRGQRRGRPGGQHAGVARSCADEDDPSGRAGGRAGARHRVLLILARRASFLGSGG